MARVLGAAPSATRSLFRMAVTKSLRKTRVYGENGIQTIRHSPAVDSSSSERPDERDEAASPSQREPGPIVLSLDLGTNNSIMAESQATGASYITTYPDSPELIHAVPTVPSLIQYDEHGVAVRYGYEVSDAAAPVIRWFKTMLLSDDESPVRREAEQLLTRLRKDEETVVTDFLTFLFANARDQLTRAGESREWHILVAMPSQADELARDRYRHCIRQACAKIKQPIRDIDIYPEGLAVARSCLSSLSKPGNYLYQIHDGGGGTTHFHMMLVRVLPDGKLLREDVWSPEYLGVGGEDMTALFETFIRQEYPELTDVQLAAFRRLWASQIKIKRSENCVIDQESKALLPPDFSLTADFWNRLSEQVFRPVLDRVMQYLERESAAGQDALQRQYHLSAPAATSHKRPPERPSIWDVLEDNSPPPQNGGDLQDARRGGRDIDGLQLRFISSGGMSNDQRLQERLRERFGDQWTRASNPRTSVVTGLLDLYRDQKNSRQSWPQAKHSYGWIGWNEATSSDVEDARYDRDLKCFTHRSPTQIIKMGSDISTGTVFKWPGRVTCSVNQPLTWPPPITLQQFSRTDIEHWHKDGTLPQAKKLMVLRFPPSVPKSMKRKRRYAADTIGPALHFRVLELQVRLKVEADGLLAEIVDPYKPATILHSQRRTYADMGLDQDNL